MKKDPIVLGINRTQDASIALMQGSKVLCCIQKERLTRQKHHWGKLGDVPLYVKHLPMLDHPIDLVVEGYSSDEEIKKINDYHEEIKTYLKFTSTPNIIQISHHLSHAYSAFFPSSYSSAAVMVIDYVGSPVSQFTESCQHSNSNAELFEVSSFYVAKDKKLECIGKQLWDGNKKNPVGLGQFYYLLTQCLFPGEGHDGKVMGLAPYGYPAVLNLPPLIVKGYEVYYPKEWMDLFNDPARFSFFIDGKGSFQNCANLAAAGQKVFEDALLQITYWLQKHTGLKVLCYAGGCALNCVANGVLLRNSPFKEIFIPAAPHDGGSALGCAIYGVINHLNYPCDFRWTTDYLGPDWQMEERLPEIIQTYSHLTLKKPNNLIEHVNDLLLQGNILALYQGRSEFGPRALGNRSILADPRYDVNTTWINQGIKGREWFRPVAPLILEEDVSSVFETNQPSPFMQFAMPVRTAYHQVIPAGTHFDGTARLQTVSEASNPFLYALLKKFKASTGIGVLINTSFNGKGETIVETLTEALNCFQKTSLHSLVIPPYIISKRDAPQNPLSL